MRLAPYPVRHGKNAKAFLNYYLLFFLPTPVLLRPSVSEILQTQLSGVSRHNNAGALSRGPLLSYFVFIFLRNLRFSPQTDFSASPEAVPFLSATGHSVPFSICPFSRNQLITRNQYFHIQNIRILRKRSRICCLSLICFRIKSRRSFIVSGIARPFRSLCSLSFLHGLPFTVQILLRLIIAAPVAVILLSSVAISAVAASIAVAVTITVAIAITVAQSLPAYL